MARDYKHAKGSGSSMSAGTGFFWGLVLGLGVAAGVHFYHVNIEKKQKVQLTEDESPAKRERTPASQKSEQQQQFDFYEELPKSEVVITERGKQANTTTPDTKIEKPGSYTLQAGSYRNYADADRVRAMLALQGVESKIVKATVDADTWHRVRIGPLHDPKAVEEVRRKLREAQIDAIVVRGE